MRLELGDRVRVGQRSSWAQGAMGTIREPPAFARHLETKPGAWEGDRRVVEGVKRRLEFYWVVFDQPQFDADGDGPYAAAELELCNLETV